MTSQKKLQKAAQEFRRENQELSYLYSLLISRMASFIAKSGAAEVTVGIKYGKLYASTNN